MCNNGSRALKNRQLKVFFFSYAGSPSKVCQPLDHIIICRVKSGQTTTQLHQGAQVDSVRHRLGLVHSSTFFNLSCTECYFQRHILGACVCALFFFLLFAVLYIGQLSVLGVFFQRLFCVCQFSNTGISGNLEMSGNLAKVGEGQGICVVREI